VQGELARALRMLAGHTDAASAANLRARAQAILDPLERRGAIDAELRDELGRQR